MGIHKGWNEAQITAWRENVEAGGVVRDYGIIESLMTSLPAHTHTVEQYATMSDGHPAFRVTVGDLDNSNPNILILGGVHGYEPSGVQAAAKFVREEAPKLTNEFNFVVYPCISPWAYKYDQRWNAQAQDPNRLFARGEKFADIEECRHFMNSMEAHATPFTAALDLHETRDCDVDLRILRSERFGTLLSSDYKEIPQGFYLMLSTGNSYDENERRVLFGESIIESVRKISPIAPEKTILEGKPNHGGIILTPSSPGLTRHYLGDFAKLVAVTEVYPDHKDVGPIKAIEAQLAAINGALNHVRTLNL